MGSPYANGVYHRAKYTACAHKGPALYCTWHTPHVRWDAKAAVDSPGIFCTVLCTVSCLHCIILYLHGAILCTAQMPVHRTVTASALQRSTGITSTMTYRLRCRYDTHKCNININRSLGHHSPTDTSFRSGVTVVQRPWPLAKFNGFILVCGSLTGIISVRLLRSH
jgi:hypothetical protein